jgi:hypothetical protein
MPADYAEGFWSRVNLHAPPKPPKVFGGENVESTHFLPMCSPTKQNFDTS